MALFSSHSVATSPAQKNSGWGKRPLIRLYRKQTVQDKYFHPEKAHKALSGHCFGRSSGAGTQMSRFASV